ncbi:MAG TPA: heavy metal-associated domain-containing protein [Vicinamibacterales bacterium]
MTLELAISGMSCQNCVRHVTKALTGLPGVTVRHVDIGKATVETSGDPAATEEMLRKLEDEGYPARVV